MCLCVYQLAHVTLFPFVPLSLVPIWSDSFNRQDLASSTFKPCFTFHPVGTHKRSEPLYACMYTHKLVG